MAQDGGVARSQVGSGETGIMTDKSLYRIWWLDQPATEMVMEWIEDPDMTLPLPQYIIDEVNSRYGRAGRCRLWVPTDFPNLGVDPWPANELTAELKKMCAGGVVFKAEDLGVVKSLAEFGPCVEFITDFDMNLV